MKRFYIVPLLLLCFVCAHAETLLLRTGARVQGTIVFQNEEVVIIRDAGGTRFQYPRADVQEILADNQENPEPSDSPDKEITTAKKASILLEFGGGAAVIPGESAGGAFSADLLVGSHHIAGRHIFIGGGVGYHGFFLGQEKYNFLPVQVAMRAPFTEHKHAPVGGLSLGYGIALNRNYLGGIYAGVDFGYRCRLNTQSAIALVAFVNFQQARLTLNETIDDTPFTNTVGRNLLLSGLKLALYF